MAGRRINRGPRKAEQEVTAQWVEDRIKTEVDKARGDLQLIRDIVTVKLMFYEELKQGMSRLLVYFLSTVDDQGTTPRRLITELAQMMDSIYSYEMADMPLEQFRALNRQDVRRLVEVIVTAHTSSPASIGADALSWAQHMGVNPEAAEMLAASIGYETGGLVRRQLANDNDEDIMTNIIDEDGDDVEIVPHRARRRR